MSVDGEEHEHHFITHVALPIAVSKDVIDHVCNASDVASMNHPKHHSEIYADLESPFNNVSNALAVNHEHTDRAETSCNNVNESAVHSWKKVDEKHGPHSARLGHLPLDSALEHEHSI